MNVVRRILWIGIASFLFLAFSWSMMTETVDQAEFAVVALFGNVKSIVDEPGLIVVNPLSTVTKVPRRVLEYTSDKPSAAPTGDKKNVVISHFTKYRIVDPVKFLRTVRTKFGADNAIADIIYSELKSEISRHPLEKVITDRQEMAKSIIAHSRDRIAEYGIELVDFRVKHSELPENVIGSVYTRMRAERAQMAQTYRSEGAKKKMELTAGAERKEKEILSEAYRKKQEIMGQGDAEALQILQDAYSRDVDLALFLKTLDVYRIALEERNTQVILSTGSELMKYLNDPGKPGK